MATVASFHAVLPESIVEDKRGSGEGLKIVLVALAFVLAVAGLIGIGILARGAVAATPVPGVEAAISQAER